MHKSEIGMTLIKDEVNSIPAPWGESHMDPAKLGMMRAKDQATQLTGQALISEEFSRFLGLLIDKRAN